MTMEAKRPNRDSVLVIQPYPMVKPDELGDDIIDPNIAAINCGIRHAAAIWPSTTHQEFLDA